MSDIEIIEIENFNQIPKGVIWRGYCACPSVEYAIQDYQEHHGIPTQAWVKRTASGRCTVYVGGA